MLHHQFHDELPGTSRAPVYDDIDADYDQVTDAMGSILDTALAEIGNRVDTRGDGLPILVFNPLSWTRSEPVRVSLRFAEQPQNIVVQTATGAALTTQVLSLEQRGRAWYAEALFFAEAVPSLGYRLFRALGNGPAPAAAGGVDVTGTRLENQYLRATVDPQTGHLTSLYSKFAGRESLAGPANILQAIAEQPGRTAPGPSP